MTDYELKDRKYRAANGLLNASSYMTMEELRMVERITDSCNGRYDRSRKARQFVPGWLDAPGA